MIQNELDIRLKPAIENTNSTKVPLDGEVVFVKDTSNSANNNIRIGNGSTAISSLSNFLTMGGQGGGGTVTSVRVQATSPVQSSESSAQSTTLNTTISLADAYGDTKNPYSSKTANYVLAAPNNSAGAPSFRALVAADIPNLSWSKLTSGVPTTLSGYGITDANISNGTITLGSNTITPLTSHAYRPVKVSGAEIIGSSSSTALNLVAGGTVSIDPEIVNNAYTGKITISATGGGTGNDYKTTLNGTSYPSSPASGAISLGSWYAPTDAGMSGQFLISNGSGAPSWNSFTSGGVSEGNLTTSSLKYYSTIKGGVGNTGISYLKVSSHFTGEQSYRTVYLRGNSAAPLLIYDGTGNQVLNQIITSNGTIVAPTSADNGKYLKATVSGNNTSFSWDTPSGGGSYTLPTAHEGTLGGLIVSSDTDADTGYRNLDSAVAVPVFYGTVSNMYTRDKDSQDYDMENPSEETTHYINVRDVFNGIIHDQEMAIQFKEFLTWLMEHNPSQEWPWWEHKE